MADPGADEAPAAAPADDGAPAAEAPAAGAAPAAAAPAAEGGRKVQFSADVREMTWDGEYEPQFTAVGHTNAGTRLYTEGVSRKEERAKELAVLKEITDKERDGPCTFKPEVTPSAHAVARDNFAEFLQYQAKKEKEAKFNLQRKTQEREKERPELQPLKQPWALCEKSSQIIERKIERGQYHGPVRGWKRRNASRTASRSPARREQLSPQSGFTGTPTINKVSRSLVFDGPAHDRLHRVAQDREESLQLLRAWQQEKDSLDPETGRPRFQPRVLASPHAAIHYENARIRAAGIQSPYSSPARESVVSGASAFTRRRSFNELYHHLSCRQTFSRGPPRNAAPDYTECTFTPHTNPTSTLIVERSGRRPPLYNPPQPSEPETATERSRGRRRRRDGDRSASAASRSGDEATADARERESSKVRPGRHGYSDAGDANNNFLARQCRDVLEKQRRVQQLREQLEARELTGCTFMPQLSRRSHDLYERSSYRKLCGKPHVARQLDWQPSDPDAEYAPREPPGRSPPRHIDPLRVDESRAVVSPPPAARAAADARSRPTLRRSPQPPAPEEPAAPAAPATAPPQTAAPSPAVSAGASPFLASLQSELQAVIEEWRHY